MRRTRFLRDCLLALAAMGFVLLASARTLPRPATVQFVWMGGQRLPSLCRLARPAIAQA